MCHLHRVQKKNGNPDCYMNKILHKISSSMNTDSNVSEHPEQNIDR